MKNQSENPYIIHTSIQNETAELVKLECSNCGGSLQLLDKTHAVCPFCGQNFLIDEAKGTVVNIHVDYEDSVQMRNTMRSTKLTLILFLVAAFFFVVVIFGYNIAARNSVFSSSDADIPVEERGETFLIFCKDVFGKEIADITPEEFASIKYIRYASTREENENYTTVLYSFTDYEDCASEEEFQETIRRWTYRSQQVSWPSDYTMFPGLTRIDTTDTVWLSALRFSSDCKISYVETDDSLETVSAVLNPEYIKVLHLGNMGTSLSGIEQYTNLKELKVDTNMGTAALDLRGIESCSKLEKLSLSYGYGYTGVERISGLSQLTELSINGISLGEYNFLKNLQGLTSLAICTGENPDLSELSSLPNLKRLYLLDREYITPEQIARLPDLEELQIAIEETECLALLSKMDSLKVLDIHMAIQEYRDYQLVPIDLSGLARLKNLECLTIDNFWPCELTGVEPILNLPNLAKLELGDSGMVNEINLVLKEELLNDNSALQELCIGNCSVTETKADRAWEFEFLLHYPNLKGLYLDNCGLTDISVLANLEELRICSLQNNDIADFSPLNACRKLEQVYVYGNPYEDLPLSKEVVVEEGWEL